MRRVALFALGMRLVIAGLSPAHAFDWDYSNTKFDLTADAVLGAVGSFEHWREEPLAYLKAKFDNAIPMDPRIVATGEAVTKGQYSLTNVEMIFPGLAKGGSDLHYTVVIARQNAPPRQPIVLAINGHGEVGGEGHGQAVVTPFADGGYGDYLANRGFVVIAFPNTIHESLSHLAKETDYSVLWARLADKALNAIKPALPADTRFTALGNAAGGLTTLVLTIMRDDIKALATNGAFFSLEHTRRDYRIYVHPFCNDFRAFFGYSAVYALLAPKPLMIQMGKQDGLWLGAGPSEPQSWYSGTKRGAISDETLGAYLQVREIWSKYDAPISLHIQSKGHEDVDAPAFEAFVNGIPALNPPRSPME